MKLVRLLSLALALALCAAGAPNWAAQHDQPKGHHPAGSVPAAASKSMPGKTMMEMMVDRLPQTPARPQGGMS